MNIFNTNNCLYINLTNDIPTNIKSFNDYCLIFNNDKLIAINIFNNEIRSNMKFGLIYPTDQIISNIKKFTNIDLINYDKNKIIISKIINFTPVPNSHLNYCDVLIDNNTSIKIICGAKNVKKDMYTVLAKDNSILPNGTIIKTGKVLDHISHGMLCSAKELSLTTESNGIIELLDVKDSDIGKCYKPIYKNL